MKRNERAYIPKDIIKNHIFELWSNKIMNYFLKTKVLDLIIITLITFL